MSLLRAFVGAAAAAVAARAADAPFTDCSLCTAATTELVGRLPVLTRAGASADDKAMALGEALPNFCDASNFRGRFADPAGATAPCAAFLAAAGEPFRAALLAGGGVDGACAAACEGVPAGERMPVPPPPAPRKRKFGEKPAPAGRKGTVDDPAYKAALKKQRARASRRKAASKRAGGGADDAADDEEAEPDL